MSRSLSTGSLRKTASVLTSLVVSRSLYNQSSHQQFSALVYKYCSVRSSLLIVARAFNSPQGLDNWKMISSASEKSVAERLKACQGIIFDLDGTMVNSPLDFSFMRRELGKVYPVGSHSHDILLDVDGIELAQQKQQAIELIRQIEIDAARQMTPIDGLFSIINSIDTKGMKRGLLTRNCKETVDLFNKLVLQSQGIAPFSVAISRDEMDSLPECKPHPAGIRMIW